MAHLPIYIATVFIITTLITLLLLYKAALYSKPVIIITIIWLALHAILSLAGFYQYIAGQPPRFALMLLPPVVFIALLFLLKPGRKAIDGFDVKILTLLHTVRILIEFVLYALYQHQTIPRAMTFEGPPLASANR